MLPLTESDIRSSLINATVRERGALVLPDLAALPFDEFDFLGWRDPKQPATGCVVTQLDGEVVGFLVRQSDGRIRSRPQCSWCEDVQLPNDVVQFSARLAGPAGRKGDTVGTLACAHFECSQNARRRPALAYVGFDLEAERMRRIAALRANVEAFARRVRG